MTREERRQQSQAYRHLLAEISAILFRHDPMGIAFGGNTGEYDPEAGTILPRLSKDLSVAEGTTVVHQELRRWFGEELAGPSEQYPVIAAEILSAVGRSRLWAS